eukprot:1389253-Amorphochlora_amoeboformis.AAC.3
MGVQDSGELWTGRVRGKRALRHNHVTIDASHVLVLACHREAHSQGPRPKAHVYLPSQGDFCSYQSFPTPQYVRLSMDTITYDSDDCKSNFCDPCENAGTGIDALLSLAIIGCLCALGVTYWRWLDTMSGNDVGCTTKRIVTSVVYTSVVLFLMISTSVWNECRDKIVQFGNDLTSKASAGSAEGESTLDVGWSMVTLAWITAVIAAGNQCCAVSPSPPPRANNQRTNARSAEGYQWNI